MLEYQDFQMFVLSLNKEMINITPVGVVDCGRETQLQLGEN